MRYVGKFSDLNEKVYDVIIQTGNVTTPVDITFSGDPCTITMTSKSLFDPIKSRKCTLEIVSNHYMMDLYQSSSRDAEVWITDTELDKVIFHGFLTPNSYDQSYSNLDTIELEAVDGISTLKDMRFPVNPSSYEYEKFIDLILSFLRTAHYNGTLYIPESYTNINSGNLNITNILSKLYASEANFYDDDEEHTPWTKYEALEEILKFMAWTLVPDGDDIYIVDYRMRSQYNSFSYVKYDIQAGTFTTESESKTDIVISKDDNAAGGTPSFSLEDTYNKIELSDNLYKIEEIAPNIFDNDNLEDVIVPVYQGGWIIGYTKIPLDQTQWITTTITRHWFSDDDVETDVKGYEYQSVALLKSSTGWTHHFYKHSDKSLQENYIFSDCYNPDSNSQYINAVINKYCNTIGCVIQRYAYRQNTGSTNLPTSLDWQNYLTFFITDDTTNYTGNYELYNIDQFELPVLEYEVDEEVMWKPINGTSWITIKGDLFYQYNNQKYGEDGKQKINTINVDKHVYTTAPVDKTSDIDAQKYCGIYYSYDKYKDLGYGRGFSTWKMKLQIGDKYWNGNKWTSTESTFYINYNNNPGNREDEYLPAFAWASIVPQHNYQDKVGEECYAVPIDYDDNNAPAFGKMKLTIYPPRIFPVEYESIFSARYPADYVLDWKRLPNIIYCKDFELGYIYTDDSKWWSAKKDNDNSDIVYTNVINNNYTNEFNNIELKLNTQIKDKPISRSYVCMIDNNDKKNYLKTMKHICGDSLKVQEENIIDTYYYHHKQPKKRYDCYLHGLYKPDDTFNATNVSLSGKFMIDKYTFNLRDNKMDISLVEY